MPIPELVEGWLPPGHHPATWEEVVTAFGGRHGTKRAEVLSNLLDWRDRVKQSGIRGRVLLDGSFISAKERPGDFDCIFVYDEASEKLMNESPEVAMIMSYGYWKERDYGDVFVLSEEAVRKFPQMCRLDMFDEQKDTLVPKGIVEVAL